MKRLLYLLIFIILIVSFTGCRQQASSPPSSSPSSSSTTWEMPTAASRPDTMTVDQVLYVVNEHLGYDDEDSKIFKKEAAEAFDVPATEEEAEVLYLFMIGDLEIALFASREKDCVVSAYVRALFQDAQVETYMMSYAGVFLAALEPNDYEEMLAQVLPADPEETEILKTSSGEAWSITYNRSLMTINPKEDAAQLPET
jgi:hypothetical protein